MGGVWQALASGFLGLRPSGRAPAAGGTALAVATRAAKPVVVPRFWDRPEHDPAA
jgi:hypothetical protein